MEERKLFVLHELILYQWYNARKVNLSPITLLFVVGFINLFCDEVLRLKQHFPNSGLEFLSPVVETATKVLGKSH